jgi:protein arginine kinase activator
MKKCTRCENKPATLHITDIQEGVVEALHLCQSCAEEYFESAEQAPNIEEPVAFADKLPEIPDLEVDSEHANLICPNCGISFAEFRSKGRLGCPHDYISFEEELLPLLENIHGSTQHVGKYPKRAPDASRKQFELIRLRNELNLAVEDEDYEEAARLRDLIKNVSQEAGEDEQVSETET